MLFASTLGIPSSDAQTSANITVTLALVAQCPAARQGGLLVSVRHKAAADHVEAEWPFGAVLQSNLRATVDIGCGSDINRSAS
jgi:hypothetical protein